MRPSPLLAISRQLVGLAWPLVISRSTQVLAGVSDAVLVAHLGQDALAATAGGALDVWALLVLPLGVVSIVSAFSSQLVGAGDLPGARRFALHGLRLALGTQILALALLPSIPWALLHLDMSPELRALTAAYLRVRLCSAGAAVGLEALASHSCGRGDTRRPMAAAVALLVLNVAGNWLLIDGRLGLPAMGVAGSALASTVATTVAFGGLLVAFLAERARGPVDPRASSTSELVRMLRVGLPVGLNGFLEAFAFAFFVNVVVVRFGTTTLAALLAVLQISAFSTLPSFALASAGAVVVGQAIGGGAGDEAPRVVRLTLAGAAAWQGILGLAYAVLSRPLLSLFVAAGESSSALFDVGAPLLVLSAAWTLFEAMAAIYAEALSAAGDTAAVLRARAALYAVVFAPGAWILVHRVHASCTAVIGWFVASIALLVAILHRRFHGGAWRRIRLTSFVALPLGLAAGA